MGGVPCLCHPGHTLSWRAAQWGLAAPVLGDWNCERYQVYPNPDTASQLPEPSPRNHPFPCPARSDVPARRGRQAECRHPGKAGGCYRAAYRAGRPMPDIPGCAGTPAGGGEGKGGGSACRGRASPLVFPCWFGRVARRRAVPAMPAPGLAGSDRQLPSEPAHRCRPCAAPLPFRARHPCPPPLDARRAPSRRPSCRPCCARASSRPPPPWSMPCWARCPARRLSPR